MANTRSKSRHIRRPSGSPLHRRSPPQKKAKPPAPPVLRTFCQHGPPGDCACGSDFGPRDPESYTTGRTPASNAVSEVFVQDNLGITSSELTNIVCISMALKEALVDVTSAANAHAEYGPSDRYWQVVDADGKPILWLARAAELLQQRHVISAFEQSEVISGFQALEGDTENDNPGKGISVHSSIVNLQTGQVDVKTVLGRAWVCYAFVPAVMRLLQQDRVTGLFAKLMRADNTNGVRAYLLYQVVKCGLGEMAMRRRAAWEMVLARRGAENMAKRVQELEERAEVQQGQGTRDSEVVARLVKEVKENREWNTEQITRLQHTHMELEDCDREIKEGMERINARVEDSRTELKDSIVRLAEAHATDLQATRELFTSVLQDTRTMLSTDQFESRSWMKEAVENIRTTILSTRPPPSHEFSTQVDLPPGPPPGPPLLFLRVRNPTSDDDIPTGERFARIYSAGESTFAVARGLLRPFHKPFIIAVMGYSGAGKSYTVLGEDGVIAALLGRLGGVGVGGVGVDIKVYQVLSIAQSIGDFAYPDHPIGQILAGISKARTTARTPANETSSRAHMMVTFENADTGEVLGTVIDVTGAEESSNRDLLDAEMKRTSAAIAVENGEIRKLLLELGTSGKQGFVSRKIVSEVKRTSALNYEVAKFLACVKGEPAVRVLLCVDGSRPDLVSRSMSLVPSFWRWRLRPCRGSLFSPGIFLDGHVLVCRTSWDRSGHVNVLL